MVTPRQHRTIAASILLGALWAALPMATLPAAAKVKEQPISGAESLPPGTPMSAKDLRILYAGKTWVWDGGGGYLEKGGRFYAAVGQDPSTAAYARGTWLSSGQGRMCFEGRWTTESKRSSARTCFLHRKSGETIFQKKEPSGEWYVFKNSPPHDDDEFGKLVEGDRVSAQLKQIEDSFSAK